MKIGSRLAGIGNTVLMRAVILGVAGAWCATAPAQDAPMPLDESARSQRSKKAANADVLSHDYDCGYISREQALKDLQEAVRRGEIPDPSTQELPAVAPRLLRQSAVPCVPAPTTADFFLFEDSASLLLTNFSNGALFSLMTSAANALLAAEGDQFDFIGFWVNFTPFRTLGTAFYLGMENDVSGIGAGIFNDRPFFGLAGDNVEGYVMMWNINSGFWQPGTGANANFTRLVLGQELEHRFAMFLPPLVDGRVLQGTSGCGRGAHWNFRVDGQGSGMEIAEWVGSAPANRVGGSLNFNTDIDPSNAVFSYADLYLMGYVSPAELDAGNSELRYMDTSCSSPYNGNVSNFSSADIIASAGPRLPDSTTAQKNFHTGWIMIHLPGAPPSVSELTKAASILDQWTLNWNLSTLGRGLMNNTLRPDCTADVEWQPVSADVTHTISGRQIILPEGGAQVTLDLLTSRWDPDLLGSYQVTVDSTGYTSGTAGSLTPLTTPDASAGAFIDTGRGDFVFSGAPSLSISVDTTTLDYVWNGSVAAADAAGEPGDKRYAGSLILNVSPDAEGTFRVGFVVDPATQLSDDASSPISPLTQTSALITITPGNTMCTSVDEIACDSAITFDNSFVSNAANPPYSCGFGSAHDGTLWFKFMATATKARFSSCASIGQDSTFAVYDGSCGSLLEIGCSEDDCGVSGFLGNQTITGLTIGQTYYVQFSAFRSDDRGQYSLRLECKSILPIPDSIVEDQGSGTRSRYLSFAAGEPGRPQAIRVIPTAMPAGFKSLVGETFWVGTPVAISENSGKVLPSEPPRFATLQAAMLQCTLSLADFGSAGLINVYHAAIVPGATFDIQVIDADDIGNENAFSEALSISTSGWGDILLNCTVFPCGPPNGTVEVHDLSGVADKFVNRLFSPSKSRSDFTPQVPDQIIDVFELIFVVEAFKGQPYPYPAPAPCP